MPSLSEELSQLEEHLLAVLTELNEMKEKVQRLEAENTMLIQKFSPYQNGELSETADQDASPVKTASEGQDVLSKLYKEGYHICHPAFGQPRMNNEDCIFCQGVLKNDDAH